MNMKPNGAEPSISIIIPIYNVEEWLPGCLDNVLAQAEPNTEIICVNDGSTDGSRAILEERKEQDSRIIIIDKANGGQATARNEGLKMATGKYIYFLDSDDFIKPNTLKTCIEIAERENLDLLLFDADTIYENEELRTAFPSYETYYQRKAKYEGIMAGAEMFCRMVSNNEYRVHVSIQFVKRELLIENGIVFPEGMIFEDNGYALHLMLLAKRVVHIGDRFFVRRIRGLSTMTASPSPYKILSYYLVYRYMGELLAKPELSSLLEDTEVNGCVKEVMDIRKKFAIDTYLNAKTTDIDEAKKRMSRDELMDFRRMIEASANEIQKDCEKPQRSRIKRLLSFLPPFRRQGNAD